MIAEICVWTACYLHCIKDGGDFDFYGQKVTCEELCQTDCEEESEDEAGKV